MNEQERVASPAETARLHPISRAVLAIAVLTLIAGYFVPLWEIQLWAPQYPEGLNMKIWINKLSGAFDIINGLNHYIGMAMIKAEMFPEFGFMIYLLGGLIALGLCAAVVGTRKWLWIYVATLAMGGLAGLVDFYRWGYEYGHNLDPNAAIQVPDMTYQPPLIGYKNLLNFTAYSGPDVGGWIMIGSGCIAAALLGWEQFFRKGGRPQGPAVSRGAVVVIAGLASSLAGCDVGPEPFGYGRDECAGCKMLISDQRFGAQIVTRKGRTVKFDDLRCMEEFMQSGRIETSGVKSRFVSDFNRPNAFLPIEKAHVLTSEELKSPMGSNAAAFATAAELQAAKESLSQGRGVPRPIAADNP